MSSAFPIGQVTNVKTDARYALKRVKTIDGKAAPSTSEKQKTQKCRQRLDD